MQNVGFLRRSMAFRRARSIDDCVVGDAIVSYIEAIEAKNIRECRSTVIRGVLRIVQKIRGSKAWIERA